MIAFLSYKGIEVCENVRGERDYGSVAYGEET